MRRFYIPAGSIANNVPEIVGSDARHIAQVLRMKPADMVELFDGSGWVYEARLEAVHPQCVKASVTRRHLCPSESPLNLAVATGYLKDKKMDTLARALTELGITRWLPFFAKRSVPSPSVKRLNARYQRWQKISLEAVKQCERGRLVAIDIQTDFANTLEVAQAYDLKLIFWERGAEHQRLLHRDSHHEIKSVFLLLGPEGGFDPQETAAAKSAGFVSISLGPRILRAETAIQSACALAQYRYGDMGKSA